MGNVDDLRAEEISVSVGSVRTLASPLLEQVTMLAGFAAQPWVACLHMNGRVVVRDAALAEVRALASGRTAIEMLVTPRDAAIVAGTKNFRSWSTATWKSGPFSWKSGFVHDADTLALDRDARFAIVGTQAELRVLDASSGERLSKHTGIFGRALAHEGRFFVESVGSVQVRSLPDGVQQGSVEPFPTPPGNALLAMRPGTDELVVGDRGLRTAFVDARTLAPLRTHDAAALATPELPRASWSSWDVAFSADGAISASSYGTHRWGGADKAVGWVVVREVESQRELARMRIPFTSTNPRSQSITPDGNTVFFAAGQFYGLTMLVAWTWR